jgi:hypothetical protein
MENNLRGKNLFFVGILKATEEKSRIRIRNPVCGPEDPDPYQNVMDPERWTLGHFIMECFFVYYNIVTDNCTVLLG